MQKDITTVLVEDEVNLRWHKTTKQHSLPVKLGPVDQQKRFSLKRFKLCISSLKSPASCFNVTNKIVFVNINAIFRATETVTWSGLTIHLTPFRTVVVIFQHTRPSFRAFRKLYPQYARYRSRRLQKMFDFLDQRTQPLIFFLLRGLIFWKQCEQLNYRGKGLGKHAGWFSDNIVYSLHSSVLTNHSNSTFVLWKNRHRESL